MNVPSFLVKLVDGRGGAKVTATGGAGGGGSAPAEDSKNVDKLY